MRTLYFDIDGTVLVRDTGEPKAALAGGKLEAAIRRAGIEELVCVGNFVTVIHTVREVKPAFDGIGAIISLCRGVFRDEGWFRRITRLAHDPTNRAAEIALERDGWYMDDLAPEYMLKAGLQDVYSAEAGRRILVPSAAGDGADIILWLQRVGAPQ
jgi:hypothetical protein